MAEQGSTIPRRISATRIMRNYQHHW